jgi:hypothetical protein
MENLYYTKKEFEKILNIFSSHEVKLEFENPITLMNALQKIGEMCLEKELLISFFTSKTVELLEFNIAKKQIISNGIYYPYTTVSYSPYPQVARQIEIIMEIFQFYPGIIIDLMSNYAVMYEGIETNKVERFYHWIDRNILSNIEENKWNDVLKSFNISEDTITLLKKETNNIGMTYIGFDPKNIICKVAFTTNKTSFLYRDPEKIYSSYKNINSIINLIENYSTDDLISLQYCPQNKNSVSIELLLHPDMLQQFTEKMYQYEIINSVEYDNFLQMNISKEYENCIIKFKWDDVENFCVKLYLGKFLKNSQYQ